MRSLLALAAAVLAASTAACSGAPPSDGSPDFEVDPSAQRQQPPADGTGSDITPTPTPAPSNSGKPAPSAAPSGTGTTPPAASSSGAPPPPPPPAPTTVSLTIDGVALTVTSTEIWDGVSAPGMYDLFIRVSGPGVPAGSDFIISATHTASGCVNTANYITYRPENDTQYMPKSATEPTCGLAVQTLPAAINGRFKGTFKSTLYGINTTTPKQHSIQLTFDVLRTK